MLYISEDAGRSEDGGFPGVRRAGPKSGHIALIIKRT